MRLTKQLREGIYHDLFALKFQASDTDFKKRKQAFLIEAYRSQVTKLEYQALMGLPNNLCHKQFCETYLRFSDSVYDTLTGYPGEDIQLLGSLSTHMDKRHVPEYIYKKFIALSKELEQDSKDKKDFQAQVWSVLNSVSTVKKLKELWVEATDIIDRNINPNISHATYLPATTIAHLNSIIPLPQ